MNVRSFKKVVFLVLVGSAFFASTAPALAQISCTGGTDNPSAACELATTPGCNSASCWCDPSYPLPREGYPEGNFKCLMPSYYTFGGGQCGDDPDQVRAYVYCTGDCPEPGTESTGSVSGVYPQPLGIPESVCDNGCLNYPIPGTTSENCQYTDTNGNGSIDDGEPYSCNRDYEASGSYCTGGEPDMGTPNLPEEQNCTNTDCSDQEDTTTPPPGTDPGSSDNPSVPPQNPTDPNNPGGTDDEGDGDPDTPGPDGSGTGDGDTDGDGERDIDCNPLSNPDCNFQGSGTGSNNCEVQPTCQGDPVQCAILYQVWASGCFGEDEDITGENDCNAPFSCTGSDLECAKIKLSRDQYCKLYESDGFDHSVEDDVDFDRDLTQEATETNVMEVIDDSGFAGAGACPADISVDTGIGNVAVSFASFCSLASTLRPLLILGALLIGYMIIGGKK